MLHVLLLTARGLVICSALLLVYIALFMYEDATGNLQNRLEELWIRVDDKQRAALAKHTTFLKAALSLFKGGLDTLFGGKIFTARAIAVTFCYSQASMIFLFIYSVTRFVDAAYRKPMILRALGTSTFLAILGTSSILIKTRRATIAWASTVIVTGVLVFLISLPLALSFASSLGEVLQYWRRADWTAFLNFPGIFIAGIACDILFVALNRWIIKLSIPLKSSFQILLMVTANCVIAIAYTAPAWLWPPSFADTTTIYDYANIIADTNLITAFLACSIVLIMLISLLHRAFWPLVSRPVYAIARFEVMRKPVLLLSTSILLLAWAIPGWQPFLAKLKGIL